MAFHRRQCLVFSGTGESRESLLCLVSAAHPHLAPAATTCKSRTSSQHVITRQVAEALYLARRLLLVVRETTLRGADCSLPCGS